MISGQKSSKCGRGSTPYSEIESLAGVFHPHAIEVQDFSSYDLIVDLRSRAEYDADHVPGAIHLGPTPAADNLRGATKPQRSTQLAQSQQATNVGATLTAALASAVGLLTVNQPILMYCGRGGRDSESLANILRRDGRTVDVLPGGWINYRRWVEAGLEILPRLVEFRVFACALGNESVRLGQAIQDAGHQTLDLEKLAGFRHGTLGAAEGPQPSQAWFESQLLHAIRWLDPRKPAWIRDTGGHVGSVLVPGALANSLAIAPMITLQVPISERIKRWREDEPLLRGKASDLDRALVALSPAPIDMLLALWRDLAVRGDIEPLISSLLSDYFDPLQTRSTAERSIQRHCFPDLIVKSLHPRKLSASVSARFPVSESTRAGAG